MLKKIFGPKRDGVTINWTKLRNEQLHALYSSPNVIPAFKAKRRRWVGHAARVKEKCIHGFNFGIKGKITTWKT